MAKQSSKDQELIAKKDRIKEIAAIQRLSRYKKWRAARDFALKVNPALRKEHEIHLKEVETLREQQDNPEARSEGGTLRFSLSIPETMVSVIQKFDPSFMSWDKRKYGTKDGSNVEARKLMKVFPEYKIPTSEK